MEKKNVKKAAKKQPPKRKPKKNNINSSLDDLGLEPPRIYRDSQRSIQERRNASSQKTSKSNNLTRSQRRAAETKKRKKRSLFRKIMAWFAVVVFIIALGAILSLTVFFHIQDVTVSGNKRYKTEEILAQCTIDKGENLFMVDTKSSEEQLEKSLPYIYNAEIKRKLPYTIEIGITEAKPAYSIKNKDKTYILLDDSFKVLELNAKKQKGIKISRASVKSAVAGNKIIFNNKDIGNCLIQLSKTVKENNFKEITSIYSNNISDNYVVYDGRIRFKLGNCDDLQSKIYKGLAACEQLNESSPNVKGTMTISGDKSVYFTEDNA